MRQGVEGLGYRHLGMSGKSRSPWSGRYLPHGPLDLILSLSVQSALQEPERTYLLAKARALRDGVETIAKSGGTATAPDEAERRRIEASPLYLLGRVERHEELPEVEVHGVGEQEEEGVGLMNSAAYKAEELQAFLRFVVGEMKGELVVELLRDLKPRPRWADRKDAGRVARARLRGLEV